MLVLTTEAQQDRDDFNRRYGDSGCLCFICPPCSYCTHPGNPNNQAECKDAWEEVEDDGSV